MSSPRRLVRFLPISLGALAHLVVIWLPSIILRRTGLPHWPWLIVIALSLAPFSTALILYGMKRLREPAQGERSERGL